MKVATMQDLSCLGKCSLTLALPVLSCMGIETAVIPTMLLSTHTGGFGKPSIRALNTEGEAILAHWESFSPEFDALLIGYLGSMDAVHLAEAFIEKFGKRASVLFDPAMADYGKLYGGLDEAYAKAVTHLALRADILLPNITEAAMMTGERVIEKHCTKQQAEALLQKLRDMGARQVVLKGYPRAGQSVLHADGQISFIEAEMLDGHYHGSGDLFAAAFTGHYLHTKDMDAAAGKAGQFVRRAIELTAQAGRDNRMGLCFEGALPLLCKESESFTQN